MRVLDIFSGIGGFSLGLGRAGMQTVGFCEIEPFPSYFLKKHWPEAALFGDIRNVTGEIIRERCGRIDILAGGPPCQPASVAGQRRGTADDRWLWPEFLRMVSEVDPMWVLAENPPDVLSIDVDGIRFSEWLTVRLQSLGFTLFPILLSAEMFGAPQERQRIFFLAYSDRLRKQQSEGAIGELGGWTGNGSKEMAVSQSLGRREGQSESSGEQGRLDAAECGEEMEHANSTGNGRLPIEAGANLAISRIAGEAMGNSHGSRLSVNLRERRDNGAEFASFERANWPMGQGYEQWEWEPRRTITDREVIAYLGIDPSGLSTRLARYWRRRAVEAIGNSVVPLCAEILGRMIQAFHSREMGD